MSNIPDIVDNHKILTVKTRGLNVETINSIFLNDAASVVFGDRTLDYMIYRNGSMFFQENKNKTCLTYNQSGTKYANGNLLFYIDTTYCITTTAILAQNETYFYAVVNNKNLLEFDVIGIDRNTGILIGKVDISGSATTFYGGDQTKVNAVLSVDNTYNLNPSVPSPFLNPKNVAISETIYIINNNIFDNQCFNVGILINNNYMADNNNKTTLESILVSYRPNTRTENGITFYDGGSFVVDNKGRVMGMLIQKLEADNTADHNISVAISSNIVNSVLMKYISKDVNGIAFDQNEPILNNWLGIAYYPLTPASSSIDSIDTNNFHKAYGSLGGLVINGFMESYNGTNFKDINYSSTLGSNVKLNNPFLYPQTDFYTNFTSAYKPVMTEVSFYSTVEKKQISLELGTYSGQNSISRFTYEYGPDSTGIYNDIGLTYYYLNGVGNYTKTIETVKSMITAYRSTSFNNFNFKIANKNMENYEYGCNVDLSSYDRVLGSLEEWPVGNARIVEPSIIGNVSRGIVFVTADQPGVLKTPERPFYYYPGSTMRFDFGVSTTTPFSVYYQNYENPQSRFRMETVFTDNQNIKLQQNTQIPLVMAGNVNLGGYHYEKDDSINYLNSINYPV